MTGESVPEPTLLLIDTDVRDWLTQAGIPPTGFTERLQIVESHFGAVQATLDELARRNSTAGIHDRQRDTFDKIIASFRDAYRLPAPTSQELQETDQALRERVLPEVSEQELQEAVEEIPADPEKLKLAAVLTDLLQRVPPVPAPWLAFVLVFWAAMQMNPDVVSAVALAYAVAVTVKPGGPNSSG
jgi:hypothetical protein